jgi:hypothetical protein
VPTVLRRGPYRLFFYSNEGYEHPHIHVQRDRKIAKVWLDPTRLATSGGFSPVETGEIERNVEAEREMLLEAWHDFFQH